MPPLCQQAINTMIGRGYPQPIVDHATQRLLALDPCKNSATNQHQDISQNNE